LALKSELLCGIIQKLGARRCLELAKTEASRVPRKTGRTSGVERQAATAEGGVAPLNGG